MTPEKIDMFLVANSEKFPEDKKMLIREKLLAVDDSKWAMVSTYSPKNPVTLLIVSVLLGSLGVDRFMLGQVGLGILKLITCGGIGIWTLIDWFLIYGITKKYSYNKFLSYLD